VTAETIPAEIRDEYADWEWTPAWTYDDRVTTWRLSQRNETRYVKVSSSDATITLPAEAARMDWAAKYIRVPRVLDYGGADGLDWLVSAEMSGTPATQDHRRRQHRAQQSDAERGGRRRLRGERRGVGAAR
jgi:kanamycin kinase